VSIVLTALAAAFFIAMCAYLAFDAARQADERRNGKRGFRLFEGRE